MNAFNTSIARKLSVLASFILLSTAARLHSQEINDLVFIHHSCGENWLNSGLNDALIAKDYVDERNDITYGTQMPSDPGRPPSLGDVPGDNTDMNHWILWFNDYLENVKYYGSEDGYNRIILFKSCFPNSDIGSDGIEPGDPFSDDKTLANYRAVYRHPGGPGVTYSVDGTVYSPLEDIFARHPEILFIPITAPPLCYGCTGDANAHRARVFNTWLKTEWLSSYRAAHPGLSNVAVFDWFDFLANPDNAPVGPNRLKEAYGGTSDDSHPNEAANEASTVVFATGPGNFLDSAWSAYTASTGVRFAEPRTEPSSLLLPQNYPNPFNPETKILFSLPETARVRLTVYDLAGREAATLLNEEKGAGTYNVLFDGRKCPSGVYFYRLETGSSSVIRKMIMMK